MYTNGCIQINWLENILSSQNDTNCFQELIWYRSPKISQTKLQNLIFCLRTVWDVSEPFTRGYFIQHNHWRKRNLKKWRKGYWIKLKRKKLSCRRHPKDTCKILHQIKQSFLLTIQETEIKLNYVKQRQFEFAFKTG